MTNFKKIDFLKSLCKATRAELIKWRIDEDNDDADIFHGKIAGEEFKIELIYLTKSDSEGVERSLARIQSRHSYETFAIGTAGYDLILNMLSENIFGWKQSHEKSSQSLKRLTDKINKEITEQKR